MSVPWSVGEVPCFYNAPVTGRPQHCNYKDIPERKSRYPFGFGLTYSNFEYGDALVEGNVAKAAVRNAGSRRATETVQLYVRQVVCHEGWRPIRELRGFRRVTLGPGESAEVSFDLNDKVLGYTDRDGRFRCDDGEYMIWISKDSNVDGRKGAIYSFTNVLKTTPPVE